MKLLLDTNILLLSAIGNLPSRAEELIIDPRNNLYYSAAAIWEIVIKTQIDKLGLNMSTKSFEAEIRNRAYRALSITSEHVHMIGILPNIHKDPFDRIMIAQAYAEGMSFITTDKTLANYGDVVLFCPK